VGNAAVVFRSTDGAKIALRLLKFFLVPEFFSVVRLVITEALVHTVVRPYYEYLLTYSMAQSPS